MHISAFLLLLFQLTRLSIAAVSQNLNRLASTNTTLNLCRPPPPKSPSKENALINQSRTTNSIDYPVSGTSVVLKIPPDYRLYPAFPPEQILMTIIQAQDQISHKLSGDPFENRKFSIASQAVEIVCLDQSNPPGKFTYSIAGMALRGMAEWMSSSGAFRQLTIRVYNGVEFYGRIVVHSTQVAEATSHTIDRRRPRELDAAQRADIDRHPEARLRRK